MNDINNISSVYFLGIGGIGMSAIARYFKSSGIVVSGYDKTETNLTRQLSAEGITIHFEDNIALLDKSAQLVIYTPAIPKDHEEYNYYKQNDYKLLKRSEVLGLITGNSFSICVAGTHGKTTTSAMIAHILRDSGVGCNAFLGGIASNYNTNFWSDINNVTVAEADEYDRSFLQLKPDVAVITSMDPDHLDIYGTAKNLEDAFLQFASQIKDGGLLIVRSGLTRNSEFKVPSKIEYGSPNAEIEALNFSINNGSYTFDVKHPEGTIMNVHLNMGGMHNIENAVAAIIVARRMGLSDEQIKNAVASFKGVKRRFEYIIKESDQIFIDDYAHHPEELRALINGARALFQGKKMTVVFQPHLFSRTKDFADGFAEVLSMADQVFLLPIYPARELPIEGVSSEMILDRMTLKNAKVVSKQQLLNELASDLSILLITAGAGDIDTLIQPIKDMIDIQNLKVK